MSKDKSAHVFILALLCKLCSFSLSALPPSSYCSEYSPQGERARQCVPSVSFVFAVLVLIFPENGALILISSSALLFIFSLFHSHASTALLILMGVKIINPAELHGKVGLML